jgi:hypothetical protein
VGAGVGCACTARDYGLMSTCVPCSVNGVSLHRGGVFFYDEVVDALMVIVRAICPFSYLNFTNRGVSAAGGGMAYKAGFELCNKIMFAGWRSESSLAINKRGH